MGLIAAVPHGHGTIRTAHHDRAGAAQHDRRSVIVGEHAGAVMHDRDALCGASQ